MASSPQAVANPLLIPAAIWVIGYPLIFFITARSYKEHLAAGNHRAALRVAAIPMAAILLVAGAWWLTALLTVTR